MANRYQYRGRPTMFTQREWNDKKDLFYPRIRFNWGYHDGAQAQRNGWTEKWKSPHYDGVYEAGYHAGKRDERDGRYKNDSTGAWDSYSADTKTKADDPFQGWRQMPPEVERAYRRSMSRGRPRGGFRESASRDRVR